MKILLNTIVCRNVLYSVSNVRSQFHTNHSSKHIISSNLSHALKLNCRRFSDEKSEDINKLLSKPEVEEYLELMKSEYDKYEGVYCNIPRSILTLLKKIKENDNYLKELSILHNENDREMYELIKHEKEKREKEARRLNYQLLLNSIPENDYRDCNDVVLHINAGVGGEEAKLFTAELFDMYIKYAAFRNWSINYIKTFDSEIGGISQAEASISGKLAFYLLQNEAGIHRVQRVPETEKSGKVHTSTCKLNVLPDVAISEVVLKEKDLKFDYSRSSGAGGQNVQKTDTKVRITYLPTGHSAVSQEKRSRAENQNLALFYLKRILYEERKKEQEGQLTALKKNQATTTDRSDKVRTYNFLQNRVTDHRIHYSCHNIHGFMQGTNLLHEMILELCMKKKQTYFLNEINKILKHRNINEVFKAWKSIHQ